MKNASWLVAVLLVVHAALLAWSSYVHSPTLNEPAHLVAGIANRQFAHLDLYKVNPPLTHLVAAAPLLLTDEETNWKKYVQGPRIRSEFALGEDFVAANGERSFWLFTLARWACIPFSLLGGVICYLWARDLYGRGGGLLALALWCFSPNILGHGALITPDVAATSLGLAAAYTFWRWLREPTWGRTFTSGVVLGVAELAKMTLIVFFAIWPILWLVYRWRAHQPDAPARGFRDTWLRELAMLAARMLVAIYIVNLGYAFEGSLTPLGKFQFVSDTLRGSAASDDSDLPPPASGLATGNRFADSWVGYLPVPLPKNYVLGIDLQKRDFEHYHQPSYLRGEFRPRGWWYYYLYALAIKVPLGTWLLVILAAVFSLSPRGRGQGEGVSVSSRLQPPASSAASRRDEFVLLFPAVVILVFVSSQTGFSEHMRYVLPAFPFVFVWIGRLAPVFSRQHWIMGSLATSALAWSIASSLWVYPHSLSYFNELAGGPTGGPKHLIHSNVDWGQDLLYLKRWLDDHPEARPIKLAYFGYFDPMYAGIEYTAPEAIRPGEAIPPGWYAISVNFVRGLPHFVYRGDGTTARLKQGALTAFQELEPVGMAGYSIYIYQVGAGDQSSR